MHERWHIHPADPPRAAALAEQAGVHPVTAQLLLNRGVASAEEAKRFFAPSLASLQDPSALPDLDAAVARLKRAIAAREPILLFGDSDVDGLTASVILYEVLQSLGASVQAVQSNRITEGYGFPDTLLQRTRRSATRLVILVDCGTNQPDAVRQLAADGIETVIVDHHVPLAGWAQPAALINPHRDGCRHFRELCSAGLALKIAQALLGRTDERLAGYLDLAALGTLADCSSLRGENRVIVSLGASQIVRSRRRGLARLCDDTRTREPDPEQIIRRLVPRLNASGRLGDAGAVWRLLCHETPEGIEEWMVQAGAAHATTKQLHRQIIAQAQEQVNRLHFKDEYVMVVSRSGWHQGLMGPLAAQLSQRYGRPAIAIAMDGHQGTGSGRSVPLFNLLEALKACQGLLVRFGGHAQACGLTVDRTQLEPFRALVNQQARAALGPQGLLRSRWADLELPLGDIQPDWVEETERFAPFGQGNPRPTVAIRDVRIEATSARMAVLNDGTRRVAAKGRFPAPAEGERYDVLASPTLVERRLWLLVSAVKGSAGPWGPDRT